MTPTSLVTTSFGENNEDGEENEHGQASTPQATTGKRQECQCGGKPVEQVVEVRRKKRKVESGTGVTRIVLERISVDLEVRRKTIPQSVVDVMASGDHESARHLNPTSDGDDPRGNR